MKPLFERMVKDELEKLDAALLPLGYERYDKDIHIDDFGGSTRFLSTAIYRDVDRKVDKRLIGVIIYVGSKAAYKTNRNTSKNDLFTTQELKILDELGYTITPHHAKVTNQNIRDWFWESD